MQHAGVHVIIFFLVFFLICACYCCDCRLVHLSLICSSCSFLMHTLMHMLVFLDDVIITITIRITVTIIIILVGTLS